MFFVGGIGVGGSVVSEDTDSDEEPEDAEHRPNQSLDDTQEAGTSFRKTTGHMRKSIALGLNQAAHRAADMTTDIYTSAAQITPLLQHTVNTHIHR